MEKTYEERLPDATRALQDALNILGLTPSAYWAKTDEACPHTGPCRCDTPLDVKELDLGKTAERIVKMWAELTRGLREAPPRLTSFESGRTELQVLDRIQFVSLCSHHFAPFRGVAHVAYKPNGRVIGASKPARAIDYYAARPQTQEHLTHQVAECLWAALRPEALMVVVQAEHTCISCRGVRKLGSLFTTSAALGAFEYDSSARAEAQRYMRLGQPV